MSEATSSNFRKQPIKGFALFFRSYALGLSVVVASIPVVAGYFNLMPFFAGTKAIVTGLASIGSYLIVGFLFFQRLSLAGVYFPLRRINDRRVAYASEQKQIRNFGFLPLILTCFSLLFFAFYISTDREAVKRVAYNYGELEDGTPVSSLELTHSIQHARLPLTNNDPFEVKFYGKDSSGELDWDIQFPDQEIVKQIRAKTPDVQQPFLLVSTALFLLAFLCAVAALILMGLRDFLQGELGIPDKELLGIILTEKRRFHVDDMPGIYGYIEHSNVEPELRPIVSEPFCIWHDLTPVPTNLDASSGTVVAWKHKWPSQSGGQTQESICNFYQANLTLSEFDRRFNAAAHKKIGEK